MVYGKIAFLLAASSFYEQIDFVHFIHKTTRRNSYVFQLFQPMLPNADKAVLQSAHNRIYQRSDRAARPDGANGTNGTARSARTCRAARCRRSNRRNGCSRSPRAARSSRRAWDKRVARRFLCSQRNTNRSVEFRNSAHAVNHNPDDHDDAFKQCDFSACRHLSRNIRGNRHANDGRKSVGAIVCKRLGTRKRNRQRQRHLRKLGKSVQNHSLHRRRGRNDSFYLQHVG